MTDLAGGFRHVMKLETDHLLLRPIEPGDIPGLVGLWTDPEVTRHLGGPRERDKLWVGFTEDLANPPSGDFDLWPVVEKASGRTIGHCGLLEKTVDGSPRIELIYVIAREFWGRGYAGEIGRALTDYAFKVLGVSELIALIEPDNEISVRVAGKIGMVFEKETIRPDGSRRLVYLLQADDAAGNGA